MLQKLDIRLKRLVVLVSLRKIDAHVSHLLQLLLVDLEHSLVTFELLNLFLEVIKLALKAIDSLLVLPLHQCLLSLELCNALFLITELIGMLVLIGRNFLVHLVSLLIELLVDTQLHVFRCTVQVFHPCLKRVILGSKECYVSFKHRVLITH